MSIIVLLWVSQLHCEYYSSTVRLYFCLPQQNGKEINPQDLANKKKSAVRGSYQLKVTENGMAKIQTYFFSEVVSDI